MPTAPNHGWIPFQALAKPFSPVRMDVQFKYLTLNTTNL